MTEDEWEDRIRKETYPWMTDDQYECYRMICDLVGGSHHIPGKVKQCAHGVETNLYGGIATFDFDLLTRMVVLAHDRMIRVEVAGSSPGRIKFLFHKRHKREGRMSERHPTIEDAIIGIREG